LFSAQWGLNDIAEAESRLARWVRRISEENLMNFSVVWGYWPCFSRGNEVIITGDPPTTFHFPRQSSGDNLCLADYFRDEQEALTYGPDLLAMQLVTIGELPSRRTAELFEADSYQDYFELHGLSVQLAEAFAKMWHHKIRDELGMAPHSGERFSFGYPACPDLSQRQDLVSLLKPETIGVHLSEEFQLSPEQSTDALIVHHREARYFSLR